ncbi:hypothetical protein DTO280E4_5494 [Paecilomyces variotii]|nr:hypothetical protein DTO280E4_5494 [Paecilomyces variotii]
MIRSLATCILDSRVWYEVWTLDSSPLSAKATPRILGWWDDILFVWFGLTTNRSILYTSLRNHYIYTGRLLQKHLYLYYR